MDGSDDFSSLTGSRSSTPGQDPYGLYMPHSHARTASSQSMEDWNPSSNTYTPHPFRYNQKAPSAYIDCRQCTALKQENLILGTENNTLKMAYDALLKVVGPAFFLAQVPAPSPSGVNVNVPKPQLKQSDYPEVPFWHLHQYKAQVNQGKGESTTDDPKPRGSTRAAQGVNVTLQFVTDAEGNVIDGYRATQIRGVSAKLFLQLASRQLPGASQELCGQFPEMGLCANDWKMQYMATKMYSSWHRSYLTSLNSRAVKLELNDVKMEVNVDDTATQSNPVKRSHSGGDSAAIKRTKLSSISPPPEGNEQSERDARFFAVIVPDNNSGQPTLVDDDAVAPIPNLTAKLVAVDEEKTPAPAVSPVLFKIVNPLLSAPHPTASSISTPSPNAMTAGQAVGLPGVAAIATVAPVAVAIPPPPAPAPAPVPPKSSKEPKAVPGVSSTPRKGDYRNLCMIAWCKKNTGGARSEFKKYWATIENTPECEQYKEASVNAAASKTKGYFRSPPPNPNAPPVDPNARKSPPADPMPPVDPNALKVPPADPNARKTPPPDPNARKTPAPDPNAPLVDPNARKLPPIDPVPPVDPNAHRAPPADPNAPPVNPNVRKSLPTDPNMPPDSGKEEGSGKESKEESDEGAGKPSIRRPEESLRNLATHQEWHPDDPMQPGKPKKRKTKKGSAEKSTAGLKQKELKQVRAGLAEAVAALHLLVEEKAEELAAEYHLSLDEVKDVIRSATKFKKRRGYHEFNAKVWQRGVELNADKGPGKGLDVHQLWDIVRAEPEGTWLPEQLAQLKADYTAHQLSKKEGTQATNAKAAKDATFIGNRFFEELILLEKRTGARGFAVIAGSNVNDTIVPTVVGSPKSCKFLADVHKMTPATYTLKEEVDTDKMGHTEVKGVVAKLLQENLRRVSGNDAMKINYKNYEEIMLAFYGYEIVGWPDNVPIATPSNLGRGGSAALKLLLERLKSNTCFWRAVDGDRRKELQTKWEKQGGKKGKGKKKAAKQQEEEEEEPQTKKSKGKKRLREAKEEEEEAPAKRKTKKTAGEMRKHSKTVASEEEEAEVEETEPEPEPAKKASKKVKGGAKAVETVEGEPPKKKKKTAVEMVEEEPPKKKKTAVETDAVESVGGTAPNKTQKKKAVEVEEEDNAPGSKSKGKRKQKEDNEENALRKKAAFSKRRKAPAPGRSASVVPSDTGSKREGPDTPNTPDANTGNDTPDGTARLMAIKAKKAAAQKEADEVKARMSAANPRKISKNAVAGSSKPLKLAAINDDDEYKSSNSDDTD
ncbi:hypothetical protein DFH09DRAFT_1330723 [Mycena vulgaris]|nr:hypothetical protein DFH09DRAFT_1330723 [Mycena vulgaris]